MQDWINKQLASGLPALAGTTVSGTVAIKQELINELLSDWLGKDMRSPATPSSATVDLNALTKLVKHAEVRAEPGVVMLDFKVAV